MKLIIAALISAALIWLHSSETPINNSGNKAAAITPRHSASTSKTTAPVQTVSKVETPAPQTPVAQPETQGCTSYAGVFNQYDWNVSVAKAICQAESSGNPQAVSDPSLNYDDKSDYGLMQIHAEPIFNPQANIARAYQKYQSQGWKAWSTYNNGAYLAYIN